MESQEFGKSTIILQICNNIGKDKKVLYVSGEESAQQVSIRAERLGIKCDNLYFYGQTDMVEIEEKIYQEKPEFCIIDSIQTMNSPEITSAAGSVSQVREVTSKVMNICKKNGITTVIVGHVTKDRKYSRTKSFRTYGRYCIIFRRWKTFCI